MSAPVKTILAPTGLNNSGFYKSLPISFIISHSVRLSNMFMVSSPVFNNPLGEKFAIPVPYIGRTFIQNKVIIESVKTLDMFMVINTFPAVYTAVVLRPTYGQLWPLSGTSPY